MISISIIARGREIILQQEWTDASKVRFFLYNALQTIKENCMHIQKVKHHYYDVIIVGSGPAGLGAAFKIASSSDKSVLLLEKKKISSGGLRNDCKQNYTFPVGFPLEHWNEASANPLLEEVKAHLKPKMETRINVENTRKEQIK